MSTETTPAPETTPTNETALVPETVTTETTPSETSAGERRLRVVAGGDVRRDARRVLERQELRRVLEVLAAEVDYLDDAVVRQVLGVVLHVRQLARAATRRP